MYRHSWKPVLVGIGIGLLVIALPFILFKLALGLLIFAVVARLVKGLLLTARKHRHRQMPFGVAWHPFFTDTLRNMSDEDYQDFRQKLATNPYQSTERPITIEIQ